MSHLSKREEKNGMFTGITGQYTAELSQNRTQGYGSRNTVVRSMALISYYSYTVTLVYRTIPYSQRNEQTKKANLGGAASNYNGEFVSEPVNIVTGNYYSSVTDMELTDIGIPLTVNRYYDSIDDSNSLLGKGWRTNHETYASEDPVTGKVAVTYLDGRTIVFDPIGNGEYTALKPYMTSFLKIPIIHIRFT